MSFLRKEPIGVWYDQKLLLIIISITYAGNVPLPTKQLETTEPAYVEFMQF